MFVSKQKRLSGKSFLKMSSNLENEDLENIPLVRMEDVQPVRDRNCEIYCVVEGDNDLETCIVDDLEYDNECIVDNDEDSNIGSMVSIQSEEVEDSDSAEVIVPEVLEAKSQIKPVIVTTQKIKEIKIENNPDSWPTLEILPGGVIKHSEKCDEDLSTIYPQDNELSTELHGENMYACAKCSESFKFLYCLVKHVRWHEMQQKKQQDVSKIITKCPKETKYVCLHSVKSKIVARTRKRRVPIVKKPKS